MKTININHLMAWAAKHWPGGETGQYAIGVVRIIDFAARHPEVIERGDDYGTILRLAEADWKGMLAWAKSTAQDTQTAIQAGVSRRSTLGGKS